MNLLLDPLSTDIPAYKSLYQQIRGQILTGLLSADDRLPSSRNLAEDLNCSRGTVERAYELLISEGLLIGRGALGTRVNTHLHRQGPVEKQQPALAQSFKAGPQPEQKVTPLQLGLPALDAFPRKRWSRLLNKQARLASSYQIGHVEAAGYLPLRRAIANYLSLSRGVECEPGEVFITSGFQGALAMIIAALRTPGPAVAGRAQMGRSNPPDQVWCEDPGYFRARDCLQQLGLQIAPVAVDRKGMRVADGIAQFPDARFALVSPSLQSPLGMTLVLERRLQLLDWANTRQSWVIEDDYDGEFRYGQPPIPALKSLDAHQRVLYTGTFSKVLLPTLRLGYLVVPPGLVGDFEQVFNRLTPVGSLLEQRVIAEFMAEGHFSLHIKKMRKLYGQRRAALAQALREKCANYMEIELQEGGMQLLGWLKNGQSDVACRQAAEQFGLAPHELSKFTVRTGLPPALIMSYTNVDVTRAAQVAATLSRALRLMG